MTDMVSVEEFIGGALAYCEERVTPIVCEISTELRFGGIIRIIYRDGHIQVVVTRSWISVTNTDYPREMGTRAAMELMNKVAEYDAA